jgi:hypothetical protein
MKGPEEEELLVLASWLGMLLPGLRKREMDERRQDAEAEKTCVYVRLRIGSPLAWPYVGVTGP